MYRSTKNENSYHEYKQSLKFSLRSNYKKTEKGCYFCEPEPHIVIFKTENFYISKNNFPYDFWDGQKVIEHFLLVSKKHFSDLESKDKELLLEYGELVNKYSNKGFDIYTRTPNSPSRSQVHFHTHLIKTDEKKIKSLNFVFNPYSLIVK